MASGLRSDATIFIVDVFGEFFVYEPIEKIIKKLSKLSVNLYTKFRRQYKKAMEENPQEVQTFRAGRHKGKALKANTTHNENLAIQKVVDLLYEFFKNPKLTKFIANSPLKKQITYALKRQLGETPMKPTIDIDTLSGERYYVMLYNNKVFIYDRMKEVAYRPNRKFAQAVWNKVLPRLFRKFPHIQVEESKDSKTVLVIDSLKKVGAILGTLAAILTAVLQIKTLSIDLKNNFNREVDDHQRNQKAYYQQKARWSRHSSAFYTKKTPGFKGRMHRDDVEEFINSL